MARSQALVNFCTYFVLDILATLHYIARHDDWHRHPAISGDLARPERRRGPLFRPLLSRCFRADRAAVLALFSIGL
jgi:hypothetical protein